MMRKIITLALLLALVGPVTATDDVYVLEEALELNAKQVRFSLAGTGSITVRSCRDCSPMTLPLANSTVYLVDGEPMDRDSFAMLSGRGGEVYIFYNTQTGKITRMRLKSDL